MARVHFVNVFPGDCSIIQHASGRITMIDICDGNAETTTSQNFREAMESIGQPRGNYRMCESNTNPIDYCNGLKIGPIFRFVLSHPDMDHMDGFNRLVDEVGIKNFWDTGTRREKPSFHAGPYLEEDWDRYVRVRDGKEPGVTVVQRLSGAKFQFANQDENGRAGDGLEILAPTQELLDDPDLSDDINEGSYVILYRSAGGRVLFCGDAHDAAFDHIRRNHYKAAAGVSVMLAPHHGRDSDRSYDFLDHIRPKLTIIGCAPSQHIDYAQWRRRNLDILTSNQAGNIVLETVDGAIDVYIENRVFAEASRPGSQMIKNAQGYFWLRRIRE